MGRFRARRRDGRARNLDSFDSAGLRYARARAAYYGRPEADPRIETLADVQSCILRGEARAKLRGLYTRNGTPNELHKALLDMRKWRDGLLREWSGTAEGGGSIRSLDEARTAVLSIARAWPGACEFRVRLPADEPAQAPPVAAPAAIAGPDVSSHRADVAPVVEPVERPQEPEPADDVSALTDPTGEPERAAVERFVRVLRSADQRPRTNKDRRRDHGWGEA